MTSYQFWKSHCGDQTILRQSYLHNGISYTGKTTSLYWIGAQIYIVLASLLWVPVWLCAVYVLVQLLVLLCKPDVSGPGESIGPCNLPQHTVVLLKVAVNVATGSWWGSLVRYLAALLAIWVVMPDVSSPRESIGPCNLPRHTVVLLKVAVNVATGSWWGSLVRYLAALLAIWVVMPDVSGPGESIGPCNLPQHTVVLLKVAVNVATGSWWGSLVRYLAALLAIWVVMPDVSGPGESIGPCNLPQHTVVLLKVAVNVATGSWWGSLVRYLAALLAIWVVMPDVSGPGESIGPCNLPQHTVVLLKVAVNVATGASWWGNPVRVLSVLLGIYGLLCWKRFWLVLGTIQEIWNTILYQFIIR